MRALAIIGLLVAVLVLTLPPSSSSAPPPRHAYPATFDATRYRDTIRRHARFEALACFHVAPREWVCPLPAPRSHR